MGALAACGADTVTVHGTLSKRVGRTCSLLSAAFPSVSGRQVTFLDQTGADIGSARSGAQRLRDTPDGGCVMSSTFTLSLPVRNAYSARVSTAVSDIPPTRSFGYDELAAKGWRIDITIPGTS